MMQHFALLHNPKSGRVSLIPLVPTKSGRAYTACQTLLTFASIAQAQARLEKWKAVKVRGGATINGTYSMEVQKEETNETLTTRSI